MEFIVVGVAIPQGSARAFLPKGGRRPIITSDNPRLRSWRHLVADEAQRHVTRIFRGPVRVQLHFWLPRPKSLTKKPDAPHLTRPDVDKCVRAIFDSLSRVAWADDSQVVGLTARKDYAPVDTPPFVAIRITPLLPMPLPASRPRRPADAGAPALPL